MDRSEWFSSKMQVLDECIYLTARSPLPEDEVFQKITDLLPKAFQMTTPVSVELEIGLKRYRDAHYQRREASLTEVLKADGEEVGSIRVWYDRFPDDVDKLAILADERIFLTTITQILSGYLVKSQSAREYRSNESRAKDFLDSFKDVFYEISQDGTVLYVNDQIESVIGYPAEEVIGKNILEFVSPEDSELVLAQLGMLGSDDARFDIPARHKNGTTIWLSLSAKSITDPDGRRTLRGTIYEATTSMTSRLDLETREALYRNLINSQSNLVFQIDVRGKITYFNKRCKEYFGWIYPASIIGEKPLKTVQTYHHKRVLSYIKKSYEHPEQIFQAELDHYGKDDTTVTILWEFVSISDEHGKVSGIQLQGVDITKRKKVEKDLLIYKESVDQANIGVVLLGEDNTHIYVNEQLCRFFRQEKEAFIGKCMEEIHPLWVLERVAELSIKLARDGEFYSEPIDFERKDGSRFSTLINGKLLYDRNGRFLCKSISMLDVTDQKMQDDRIRESELQLSRAQEIANMGSWSYGLTDGSCEWSDNCFRLVGKTTEDAPWSMEEMFGHIIPEDRHIFQEAMESFGKGSESANIQFRMHIDDDGIRWFYLFIQPEFRDGEMTAIHGVSIDITKEQEAQVRELEAQERAKRQRKAIAEVISDEAVINGKMPDAMEHIAKVISAALDIQYVRVLMLSEDQKILKCVLGYSSEQQCFLKGRDFAVADYPRYFKALKKKRRLAVYDAAASPLVDELRDELLAPCSVSSMLDYGISLGGRLIGILSLWYVPSPRLWFPDEEAFASTIASIISQTFAGIEMRDAVAQLEHSEKRYRTIVETTHEGLWLLDGEDRTTFLNSRMASMLDYSTEELQGSDFFSFVDEEDLDRARRLLSCSASEGKADEYEFQLIRRDGSTIITSVKSEPIRDEKGTVIGTQKMVLDITDAKRAEEEQIARQAAEEANRSKSVFLSNMSHEIRTPLNAIIGFSQILQRDESLTPKQVDQIQTIARSGEHLLELINDILDLSKIEAGRVTINLTDFNLHTFIDDIRNLFYLPSTRKGLSLDFEGKDAIPEFITADEGKLRQVLINLLGNAMKFTKEGGIAVRLDSEERPEGTFLLGEVEDTGVGIPEKDIATIFDSFRQSEAGKHMGGTGLGLAICKQMLEFMGGSITVESTFGRGTVFRFAFPITQAEKITERESSMLDREVIGLDERSGKVRILIVDDRKENRDLLEEILMPIGFVTELAENGKEAVEKFFSWKPDCILMDLRMPVLDGYEATNQIKKDKLGSRVPVIAVTASAFEDDEKEVLRAGFDGYIRKPFRRGELFASLQKLCDITYLFSNGSGPAGEPTEPAEDDFSELSAEAAAQMLEAVEQGDMMLLEELIQGIEEDYPRIAQTLHELAGRYDYDGLMNLLAKE